VVIGHDKIFVVFTVVEKNLAFQAFTFVFCIQYEQICWKLKICVSVEKWNS